MICAEYLAKPETPDYVTGKVYGMCLSGRLIDEAPAPETKEEHIGTVNKYNLLKVEVLEAIFTALIAELAPGLRASPFFPLLRAALRRRRKSEICDLVRTSTRARRCSVRSSASSSRKLGRGSSGRAT